MSTIKPVSEGKSLTKGEGVTAIVVLVIFCLAAWLAVASTPKSNTSVSVPGKWGLPPFIEKRYQVSFDTPHPVSL